MRYAVGDVHGCVKTLRKMVEAQIQLTTGDVLYLVGDFIDKGPDSRAVIDYLYALQSNGFTVHALRGNREQELLDLVSGKGDYWDWLSRGGRETVRSFGLEGRKAEELQMIPSHYVKFLLSAPHYVELEDYIIVHAGVWDKGALYMDRESMLYARKLPKKKPGNGKKMIHGHQPYTIKQVEENVKNPLSHVYSIDTGCIQKKKGMGYLTALNMDTLDLYFQKNMDA